MSSEQEQISAMILKQIGVSHVDLHTLVDTAGSAAAVIEHRKCLRDIVSTVNDNLIDRLANIDAYQRRAEEEMLFMSKKKMRCLPYSSDEYPKRLKSIPDAPMALFYCGKADLNAQRIISIVGTRKSTPYGREMCQELVKTLHSHHPDILVVSGLAYGTDINAHRSAMECGMPTVGVVAHGLDTIYPATHRRYAADMATGNGGVLTEYFSHTAIDRSFFLHRNRIVAGMCDACVIVESAARGGSLSTARLALEYNRDVYAYPGRMTDEFSVGCNDLIKRCTAAPIVSHEQFVMDLGWADGSVKRAETSHGMPTNQKGLFDEFTPDEQSVIKCLKGKDAVSLNKIISETKLPYKTVSSILFSLEMNGLVSNVGGNEFRLRSC